jgi:hypothetical protein
MGTRGYVEAFGALSVVITLTKLAGDRGGGDYFFTLFGLVMAGTVAPYWCALGAMKRASGEWRSAIGLAAALFGAVDVAVRLQAFFFPTERSNGAMALWLPLAAVVVVPTMSVLFYRLRSPLNRRALNDEGPAEAGPRP